MGKAVSIRQEVFLVIFLFIGCFLVCSRNARAETIVLAPLGSGSFNELSLGDDKARTFSFAPAKIASGSVINLVELNVMARSTSGSSLFQSKLEKISEPGIIVNGETQNLTELYATHSWTMMSNPFAQSVWTVDDVNNWDINFGIVSSGEGIIYVSQISLVVDYEPSLTASLTASMQNPSQKAVDVPLNVTPTILFSRPLDQTTLAGIKLKKASEKNPIVPSSVSFDSTGKIVTITPNQPLELNTEYYLTILKNAVKDLEGNIVPSWTKETNQSFTTTNGAIPLGITGISSTKNTAQADNVWDHGWQWVFNVTIPEDETNISVKFDDWSDGNNILSTTGNMRIFCFQSQEHATAESAVVITASGSYTSPLVITGDLNVTMSGRQIQIVVEVKIPVGSVVGSYSTNYAILTSKP